jgi:hypothetical protein
VKTGFELITWGGIEHSRHSIKKVTRIAEFRVISPVMGFTNI